jgi:MOSC domain-containing protein YiiM/catechol 2,3-dioxygenase-like lactoylglutathione lyase family enzyme
VTSARIHQLSVSGGGVPKVPVACAQVTELGIVGDQQRMTAIHGGPYRALCLFALEVVERLRTEGHPIVPGGAGENVTTEGLDWEAVQPGLRLRLGEEVRIEVTAFAAPCQAIAASFTDGDFNWINPRLAQASSRVYAKVLRPGTIAAGDEVVVEGSFGETHNPTDLRIDGVGQVAVRVGDLERAVSFYRDRLGLELDKSGRTAEEACFALGHVELLLQGPDYDGLGPLPAGTLYFEVGDIEAAFELLADRGVAVETAPLLESSRDGTEVWVAFLRDPDGNRIALTEERL